MRRLRLAIWLAWNALRGRTVEIEASTPEGRRFYWVGVERK